MAKIETSDFIIFSCNKNNFLIFCSFQFQISFISFAISFAFSFQCFQSFQLHSCPNRCTLTCCFHFYFHWENLRFHPKAIQNSENLCFVVIYPGNGPEMANWEFMRVYPKYATVKSWSHAYSFWFKADLYAHHGAKCYKIDTTDGVIVCNIWHILRFLGLFQE